MRQAGSGSSGAVAAPIVGRRLEQLDLCGMHVEASVARFAVWRRVRSNRGDLAGEPEFGLDRRREILLPDTLGEPPDLATGPGVGVTARVAVEAVGEQDGHVARHATF